MGGLMLLRRFWPQLLGGLAAAALAIAFWARGQTIARLRAELATAKANAAVSAMSVELLAQAAQARKAEAARLLAERQGRIETLRTLTQALEASARAPQGPGCAPSAAAKTAWGTL